MSPNFIIGHMVSLHYFSLASCQVKDISWFEGLYILKLSVICPVDHILLLSKFPKLLPFCAFIKLDSYCYCLLRGTFLAWTLIHSHEDIQEGIFNVIH